MKWVDRLKSRKSHSKESSLGDMSNLNNTRMDDRAQAEPKGGDHVVKGGKKPTKASDNKFRGYSI